jgi:hypothetical protein
MGMGKRFLIKKAKGGNRQRNLTPSARTLRRAKKTPQYFAAAPQLRNPEPWSKDDADPDYSGFGSNDSMFGETGRYLKWIGEG